jgi:hypothetical protein
MIYKNSVRTSQETHHVSTTEPNRLMLCGETVAVCYEIRTEHTDTLWTVHTSQETYQFSGTEPNRLMLCVETVAVCCENCTDILWAVRTWQKTHKFSSAQPVNAVWRNSRCLLWESYWMHRYNVGSPYLKGNTSRLRYRAQPINAVWGNSRCLLWEPYGTHRYTVWSECRVVVC